MAYLNKVGVITNITHPKIRFQWVHLGLSYMLSRIDQFGGGVSLSLCILQCKLHYAQKYLRLTEVRDKVRALTL